MSSRRWRVSALQPSPFYHVWLSQFRDQRLQEKVLLHVGDSNLEVNSRPRVSCACWHLCHSHTTWRMIMNRINITWVMATLAGRACTVTLTAESQRVSRESSVKKLIRECHSLTAPDAAPALLIGMCQHLNPLASTSSSCSMCVPCAAMHPLCSRSVAQLVALLALGVMRRAVCTCAHAARFAAGVIGPRAMPAIVGAGADAPPTVALAARR